MGKKPKKQPSFFKILFTDDENTQLRLPSLFVEQYKTILPEDVKLRIPSGETWAVRLEMDEDGYFFTEGWNKFLGLQMFEFLVFTFNIKSSTFDVVSYGLHGCENELSASKSRDDIINNKPSTSRVADEEGRTLYFEILLNDHQKSRVTLPREFIVSAGLMEVETVKLEYHHTHRYTEVRLDHINRHNKTDMTTGWQAFRVINGLVIGNSYSFEFIPGKNVVRVKEVKIDTNGSGLGNKQSRAHLVGDDVALSDEETKPDVSTYGMNGCENELLADNERETDEIGSERSTSQIVDEEGSQLYFETTLKQLYRSRLNIPVGFVRAAGLIGEETVKLEYLPTHKCQEVALVERKYIIELSVGWPKFCKTNGLDYGKRYSFEFNLVKNLIQVKEVKVRNGIGLGNKRPITRDVEEEDISNPHFEIVLKKHQRSRLNIRKNFAEETGLDKKKKVGMEYGGGGRRVYVELERRDKPRLLEMASGWGKFRKENNLEYGKRYLFEFVPSKEVIQVKEVI